MLELDIFRNERLRTDPYPYLVVPGFVRGDALAAVLQDFPDIQHPGSIPVAEVTGGEAYQALLQELQSEKFRAVVAEKFALNLDGFPTLTTVRGVMREKDGRIHTDSKTKVVTVLLYLNDSWEAEGGNLRVLRDGEDIENFVEEVPPSAGTLMAFKVTDNCWHGHKPVVGKRLSIQMNYLIGEAAKGKHQFFHGLSAKLKKLFSRSASVPA
ncbi:MAG: 2OG-Fe(II) oxygenase [Porticoccaceae bacterium]|nr:2OG-Fe(II) oxygenase [Porticoccaceae bacterium]